MGGIVATAWLAATVAENWRFEPVISHLQSAKIYLCLDHFIVFGVKHFLYLATEYCGWYNTDRPHQNRGNRTLSVAAAEITGPPAEPGAVLPTTIDPKEIGCVKRCGGLLKHYYRKAV